MRVAAVVGGDVTGCPCASALVGDGHAVAVRATGQRMPCLSLAPGAGAVGAAPARGDDAWHAPSAPERCG